MSQVLKSSMSVKQGGPGMAAPAQSPVAITTAAPGVSMVGAYKPGPSTVSAPAGNYHGNPIPPQHAMPGMPGVISVQPGMLQAHSSAASGGMMPQMGPPQMVHYANHPNPHQHHAPGHTTTMVQDGGVANGNVKELSNLANTKEKTPMCLINELARFNKIQHQYTLTDEQGPAHKKTFYVLLKLGEEEYAASGPSIKKAQHAGAAIALDQTQFKHPPPKPPRVLGTGGYTNRLAGIGETESITPTVELNALAMKRGEPAVYRPIEMPRPQYFPAPNLDFRGMYNQRYHFPRYPKVFYVSLKVGHREFIGEGQTRQAARHNAAAKALKVLRNLPLPNQDSVKPQPPPEPENLGIEGEEDDDDDENDLKSEISLVHEIALKRNLSVNFEVVRESGPPHMRTFITRCVVGTFTTDGEGNGKKVSKKRAAERMLDDLRKLPSLPPQVAKPKKNITNKKKNKTLIKQFQKSNMEYGVGINPISRLIQIQQAKKEKEPVYSLVAERGMPRRREFVMQVQVGEHTTSGVGPNKKLAKRSAAESMLQILGYSRPSPQPAKPAIKTDDAGAGGEKKVTFIDQEAPASRQLVPGLLLMPDGARTGGHGAGGHYMGPSASNHSCMPSAFSTQTTAAIAKELLDTGSSPTAEAIVKSGAKPVASQSPVRPKQQLLYLADVLGFQVQFTDFPKGNNKSEFLSLVSLSTNPPQVSHGAGVTIDASHDMAALTALKSLAEMGLDKVSVGTEAKPITILKKEVKVGPAGDGPSVLSPAHVTHAAHGARPVQQLRSQMKEATKGVKLANSGEVGAASKVEAK